jgi:hypothetical protein
MQPHHPKFPHHLLPLKIYIYAFRGFIKKYYIYFLYLKEYQILYKHITVSCKIQKNEKDTLKTKYKQCEMLTSILNRKQGKKLT